MKRFGGILAVVVVLAVLGPLLSPYDYPQTDFGHILLPPDVGSRHWFGTDNLGRDLFVRVMLGIRVTLIVAVVASVVSLLIGVLYGAVAGFVGGRVDAVVT